MNDVIKYILIGLAGGTLGGMGMGGGTVLIPLLSLFTSLHQKSSQAINLISFIPMAVVALYLHYKNGLIKKQGLLLVIIPACLFAVGGSLLCIIIDVKVLRRVFGGFLIALSVLQFFADKITKKTQKK
ncbi:MAG: sulfite exporter TauE/SafE family protein [Clostridia bacterium]|nr:sulfite exporter TauE/SafE family protein [Clostridia bacterium]